MTLGGRHRSMAVLLGGALVVGWFGLLAGAAGRATADDDGVDLRVVVIGTTPSASASSSASPSTSGSPSARPSSRPSYPPGTTPPTSPTSDPPGPGTPSPTPTPEEDPLQGLFHASGLKAVYSPSINPFGGAVFTSFTVRNVTGKTVDASALFWITNPFGGTIGNPVTVPVKKLKPGETRTVSATLGGVGQWGYLTAHATFTPPEKIGRLMLKPVTRDAAVLFLPWFPLVVGGPCVLGGVAFFRWRRYGRIWGRPGPFGGEVDA